MNGAGHRVLSGGGRKCSVRTCIPCTRAACDRCATGLPHPRVREMAVLVARGFTNRQIASGYPSLSIQPPPTSEGYSRSQTFNLVRRSARG